MGWVSEDEFEEPRTRTANTVDAKIRSETDTDAVLHVADPTTYQFEAGSPGCDRWVKNNETSFIHTFAKVPAIHNFSWIFFFLVIGPAYCPDHATTFLMVYFAYMWARVTTISLGAVDALRRVVNAKRANEVWSEKPISSPSGPAFRDVVHSVILCQYAEPVDKLEQTLQTLANQSENVSQQIVVTMATEARDDNGVTNAMILRNQFKRQFKAFYITRHTITENESAGKSSNENWAARCTATKLIDELGLNINNITITSCDADTFFSPEHFAELTHRFCSCEQRYEKFWQTPIAHIANIFELPMFCQARYLMVTMAHLGVGNCPWFKAYPFSTYTLSMKLCKRAGFWDPQFMSEDYHMYLKCFFVTHGDVSMDYMWRPVGCDAPITNSAISTFQACFLQHKRWMLGALDLGYFVLHAVRDRQMPLHKKIYTFLLIYEFHMLYPAMWMNALIWIYGYQTALFDITLAGVISHWYKIIPSVTFLTAIDLTLREYVLADRMHMDCSLRKDRPLTFWLFFPIIFLLNPIADIICTMIATYTAQVTLAINPVQEYITSPKMVTGPSHGPARDRSSSHDIYSGNLSDFIGTPSREKKTTSPRQSGSSSKWGQQAQGGITSLV